MEFLLIFGILLLVLTFFYKEAIGEYRINQLNWSSADLLHHPWHHSTPLTSLMGEKSPIVLRQLPMTTVWTRNDVTARAAIYDSVPLFRQQTFTEWLQGTSAATRCPWKKENAVALARVSGLAVWAQTTLNPALLHSPLHRVWLSINAPVYSCWAGAVGLTKTYAAWTVLLPMEGTVRVSLLHQQMERYLPAACRGELIHQLTPAHTPFVADLNYMDVILRPGTCLLLPPHWLYSYSSEKGCPMVCHIEYHSPLSSLASTFHGGT